MNTTEAVVATVAMENQWIPFTPNRDFKRDPRLFEGAKGNYFFGPEGTPILDGSSGLFTTPAGHARQEIATAIYEQVLELDYTSSFLRSHPKSFALCEKLTELLPEGLNKIFLVNSGSEAVDTAVKIALHYHRVRKESSRTIFVSRERAYHGANMTGVALSGLVNNRRAFGLPILPVVHMRHTWLEQNRFVPGQGQHGAELAEDLLRLIQLHGAENIAACIVEPIAGSTGTLVAPVGYLERLREICTANGILLIFDEVITGFGRTGMPFAAQSFGVTPDIITMAKAITNGIIPMGAVAVSEAIHDTIVGSGVEGSVEFFHGYTGSAHPVSCAASMATLGIYEREDLFARGRKLSGRFLEGLFGLRDAPGILDVRGYGMMGGIDIDPTVLGMDGYGFQKLLYDMGLHIKSTGNSLVYAPPFTLSEEEIDQVVGITREALGVAKANK
ncbi:aspartate aminotransferase family protein [soil metagenome]